MAIELKYKGDDRGKDAKIFDLTKLEALTRIDGAYSYHLGVFIEISSEEAEITNVICGDVTDRLKVSNPYQVSARNGD